MKKRIAAVLTGLAVLTASAPATAADLPAPVRRFISGGFGQAAPKAPAENRFFTALVGLWRCRFKFDDGYGFPATWAFKHSVGGYAVEHLYFQAEKDLVPPFKDLKRDYESVALTFYEPSSKTWRFLSAANVPSADARSGQVTDGRLIFVAPDGKERDSFGAVTADSFDWKQEAAAGSGWELNAHIVCDRS